MPLKFFESVFFCDNVFQNRPLKHIVTFFSSTSRRRENRISAPKFQAIDLPVTGPLTTHSNSSLELQFSRPPMASGTNMEITPKILVVEDNREMRELVSKALRKEGYRVSLAGDGKEMNRALDNERVDLIILDVMLPGDDGLTLCRDLRTKATTPVIIISAKGEELDRVLGLKMGADDYLPKPFSTLELIARVQAVLRRIDREPAAAPNESGKIYKFNGWRLDVERRELIAADNVIVPLSTGEFSLLQVLVQRPNRVLSREQLLDLARGRDSVAFDRSIDTQVSRLRRKIEHDPKNPTIIKTVWGGGYVLSAEVAQE